MVLWELIEEVIKKWRKVRISGLVNKKWGKDKISGWLIKKY